MASSSFETETQGAPTKMQLEIVSIPNSEAGGMEPGRTRSRAVEFDITNSTTMKAPALAPGGTESRGWFPKLQSLCRDHWL